MTLKDTGTCVIAGRAFVLSTIRWTWIVHLLVFTTILDLLRRANGNSDYLWLCMLHTDSKGHPSTRTTRAKAVSESPTAAGQR